jgi:hypothetical protein
MDKNALYLEADEDITSAIDKLRKAAAGPVSIVVPKRSTLLQSVINLKLLKKAAADTGHELILVTGDKVATDLAARIGLAVAATLGGKAVMTAPEAAKAPEGEDIIDGADDTPVPAVPAPALEPVKPTPAAKSTDKLATRSTSFHHRDVADENVVEEGDAGIAAETIAAESALADKPPKGLHVPNYNKLTKRLLWVGLAVLLVVGYVVGVYFFSTAKVTLFAASNPTNITSQFSIDTSATTSSGTTLAGQSLTDTKTLTGTFQATGSQDDGTKASGNLTVKNCSSNSTESIPAGTTFTSNGLNFVSTSAASISGAGFAGGSCFIAGTGTIPVTASANGDQYNLGNATFTSPALDSHNTITCNQLSGGTTKIDKVVQQSDIDTEKATLLTADQAGAQKTLGGKSPSGFTALVGSFAQSSDGGTANPALGQPATSATLTVQVTYTEIAVNTKDYQAYVQTTEQKQVGAANQVYDNGLGSAQVAPEGAANGTVQGFSFATTAFGGPKLDTTQIAAQLAGKQYSAAGDIANGLPGVQTSDISIWPGWVGSMPHVKNHIKITISVAKSNS